MILTKVIKLGLIQLFLYTFFDIEYIKERIIFQTVSLL